MFPFDLPTWMLVFVRVSAMLAIFPIFSQQGMPVKLRLALGAACAWLILPTVPMPALPASLAGLIWLLIKEAGIGLLLGFISRLVFYILEFAGNVLAAELGMNWGATLNPFSSGRGEAPGLILYYLGAMIFLSLNLHHALLIAFHRCYQVLPINGAHPTPALFNDFVQRTGQLFSAGLLMAAPVVAVSFLINLVFSVIGRAVPQMNVFSESFSFRALAGLVVFGLTLNLIAQHAVNYLRRLPEDFVRVAALLAGG
jgi:flagellar biosynthesis protein FliR